MKLSKSDIPMVKQLLFIDQVPLRKVAERYNVSIRTVERWRRKYRVFGGPYAPTPKSVVQRRPKLLTDAQIEVGIVFLSFMPRLTVS